MRITSAKVTKAIAHIAKATEGDYRAQVGGSRVKESGTRYVAAEQQVVYDSALGENRDALAFFLGVMDGYGILAGEWAEWRDALNADEYAKHFDNGREDARRMKIATERQAAKRAEDHAVFIEEQPRINAELDRRVESSSQDPTSETAYEGQNWATHSVEVWITNDSTFFYTAQNYARYDETGEQLGQYIDRLLFARPELPAEERRRITRDDAHTLKLVAGDLTRDDDTTPAREALKRVNWKYIAASLTDEG
jgi:hypothetical protein